MITLKDQERLFTMIADRLSKDVTCWAFGGNAMMWYGYKEETKDVDLLFESEADRQLAIAALQRVGFKETSPFRIYIPEKLKAEHRPVMLQLGDSRIDLFATQVFRTRLSPKMKEDAEAVHEYRGRQKLTVKVLRKEHVILLKAVTSRDKDAEDIRTIVGLEKKLDWDLLIDETLWQYAHGDTWSLFDMERALHDVDDLVFIPEAYFKKLYAAVDAKAKATKKTLQKKRNDAKRMRTKKSLTKRTAGRQATRSVTEQARRKSAKARK